MAVNRVALIHVFELEIEMKTVTAKSTQRTIIEVARTISFLFTHLVTLVACVLFVSIASAQRQPATNVSTGPSGRTLRWILLEEEQSMEEGKLESLTSHFTPQLLEELSPKKFQSLWEGVANRVGQIRDVDIEGDVHFGTTRLMRIHIQGQLRLMNLFLHVDDQDHITGICFNRERELDLKAGQHFGAIWRELASQMGQLKITVESPGSSQPKRTVDFYRLLDGNENPNDRDWTDREGGQSWRYFRRLQGKGSILVDHLPRGWYRVIAGERSTSSGPIQWGEPIELATNESTAEQTLRLRSANTLIINAISADTEQKLPKARFSIKRTGEHHEIVRSSNVDDQISFHVVPGQYELWGFQDAATWDDDRYEIPDEPLKLEVTGDESQEITLRLKPRNLTAEEIDRRAPWVAQGRVVDVDGEPLAGVEIWGCAGVGSLFSMKVGTTDQDGRYFGRFSTSGWQRVGAGGDTLYVVHGSVQPRLDGHFIAKHGMHKTAAANRVPREGDAIPELAQDAKLFTPGVPLEIDFVLQRASSVSLHLLDEQNEPIPNMEIRLTGKEVPHSESATTDVLGRCRLSAPAGHNLRFQIKIDKRKYALSPSLLFDSQDYQVSLRQVSEPITGKQVLELAEANVIDGDRTLTADILRMQPTERPPVGKEEQVVGRELLQKIAEANKHWLGRDLPEHIPKLEYDFVFAGSKGQHMIWNRTSLISRRGITYFSPLDIATKRPDKVVLRMIEFGEQTIRIAYSFAKGAGEISAGNGVSGSWRGYFDMGGIEVCDLYVDARTLMPIKQVSGDLVETYSAPFHVEGGHYVPLRIQINKLKMDWRFKVHPGGVWLFDRTTKMVDDVPLAQIRNVSLGIEPDHEPKVQFDQLQRVRELIRMLEGKPDRKAELAKLKSEATLLEQSQTKVGAPHPPERKRESAIDYRSENVLVSGISVSKIEVEAIGKTVQSARSVCSDLGYEMPKTISVTVTVNPRQPTRLFNDGVDQFVLSIKSADSLKKPAASGIFHLYGLCHEVAHLAMYRPIRDHSWMTAAAAEGWAHYLGSILVDAVFDREGLVLWHDPYDYRAEGTRRLKRQLRGNNRSATNEAAGHWQALASMLDHASIAKIFRTWGTTKFDPANPAKELEAALPSETELSTWWTKTKDLMIVKRQRSGFTPLKIDRGELQGNARTLQHDDGVSKGKKSLAGSGHAVRYRAGPNDHLTKVLVYGSRYGGTAETKFRLSICDAEGRLIEEQEFPYQRFPLKAGWVELELQPIKVPDEFVIHLGFNPSARNGVFVHHDSSASGQSETGLPSGRFKQFSSGDWLIRAETDIPVSIDPLREQFDAPKR